MGVQKMNISPLFSEGINFTFIVQQPVNGNDGRIEVLVTNGTPPYSYSFNGGPGSDQNIYDNLTSGIYTVTVFDSNVCFLEQSVELKGSINVDSSQIIEISSSDFNITTSGKRSIKNMFDEGFTEVTYGNSGCVLINATFTARVTILGDGITIDETVNFYNSTNVYDYPSDNQWGILRYHPYYRQ